MASRTLVRFEARLADAQRLLEIHAEATGTARGRRHNYDALSRSAVILAVAAWEGYVEDLALAAAGRIVRNLRSANDLPPNVRDGLITHLYETHGWSSLNRATKDTIWGLSGGGWRQAYISYARHRVMKLNTPKYDNVRKLLSSVTGLQDFTDGWGSARWPAEHYRGQLEASLQVRHLIAHGAIGSTTVGKAVAEEVVKHIKRFAEWTEGAMASHLNGLPRLKRPVSVKLSVAANAPLPRPH